MLKWQGCTAKASRGSGGWGGSHNLMENQTEGEWGNHIMYTLFLEIWSSILIDDVLEREKDGMVCLRIKYKKIAFVWVGPAFEIGSPYTAYYEPSGSYPSEC